MEKNIYAKINLMLKVINKREDQYHNLQMVNTRINLCDKITLNKALKDEIIFNNKNIDCSLMQNVLNRFKDIYNKKDCFQITIDKMIPIGAGLGGGSMDAGGLIDMLYDYYHICETIDNKINLFKDLGADISYSFYKQTCLVEGIGDIITSLKLDLDNEYILVYPYIYVNTKEVFNENNKYSKPYSLESISKDNIYINDLEEATSRLYPSLKRLKEELSQYGKTWMSGSGSSFIVSANDVQINDLYDILKKEYPYYLIMKISIIKEN